MKAHDIAVALQGAGDLDFQQLSTFNRGSVGVFRTSKGMSPWERHPDDDELLYVIEGEVEIIVLTENGQVHTNVPAGSVFIVPSGHWHRHNVRDRLVEMYVTPGRTEHSNANDPRAAI